MFNEGPHEPEKEGEQQRPDVGPIHIGIGHNDHLVIPEFCEVKLHPDPCAQGRDHRLQLVVANDLILPGLLHIQHFSPEGQNGLKPGIPPLSGRPACRVTLHDIDLGESRIRLIAVPQLIRHGSPSQGRLPPDGISGLLGCSSGPVGSHGLVQNGPGGLGMLL